MVYEKFIKRGGKTFGPYYYESYRDNNGKIRKKYLGPVNSNKEKRGNGSHGKFSSFFRSVRKRVTPTKIEGFNKFLLVPFVILLVLSFGLIIYNQVDSEIPSPIYKNWLGHAIVENSFGDVENFFSESFSRMVGFVISDVEESVDEGVEDVIEEDIKDEPEELEDVAEPEQVEISEEISESEVEDIEESADEDPEELSEEVEEEASVFSENETVDSEAVGELNETVESNETLTNESIELNETIAEAPIGYDFASPENETIVDDVILNETVVNETVGEINETVELNETISEENETLIDEIVVNETVELNETVLNESEIIIAIESLTTLQYKAVVHRPVKWLKKINVSIADNLTIEIPKLAENVSVLTDDEIGEAEKEIEDYESLVEDMDKEEIVSGFLTGNVVVDIRSGKGFFTKLWDWITSFTISGNVVLEDELEDDSKIIETGENKFVDVEDIVIETDAEEVAVEYYTPAPVVVEQNISGGKLITISADDVYNYTDILAYSLIGEMGIPANSDVGLKVYWRASYEDAVRYGYIEEDVAGEEKTESKEKDSDEKKKIPKKGEEPFVDVNESLNYSEVSEDVNISYDNESLVDEVVRDEEDNKTNKKKDKDEENKTVAGKDKKILITGKVVKGVEDLEQGLMNESVESSKDIPSGHENLQAGDPVVPGYVRVEVNFSIHDFDGDGIADYVEWIVPHLSNQTYEISIEILNVQSYPTVGGNWTVGFNTTGEANLTVSAFNGTTYGFDYVNDSLVYDLEFLELKCGDEVKNVSVVVNGTVVPYEVYLKKKRIEEIRRLLDG